MKRQLWTALLTDKSAPAWPCPACDNGVYTLVPSTLTFKETIGSKRRYGLRDHNPTEIEYTFMAWLKCNSCGQDAAISGVGGVDQDLDMDTREMEWIRYYRPLFCHPMPDIIPISATWPDSIKSELRSSFSLFWADRPASANRLRVTIERLMDHLKIKKRYRDGKDKQHSLHKRISMFSEHNETMGNLLLSIKWLGNTASHDSDISISDLFVAYEILEEVLAELLDKRSTNLKAKAKMLTKKHRK
jgi:hypothetical protein